VPRKGPMPESQRKAIRKSLIERYQDPQAREQLKQAREEKGANEKVRASRTPELRQAISRGSRESWSDPEKLRKRITTLLRKLERIEGRPQGSLTIAPD
jgi:hypothetical protein